MVLLSAKRLTICLLATISAVCYYSFFIEPEMITIKQISIKNNSLNNALTGKKVLFFSDLHIEENSFKKLSAINELILKINPDLILLAGDYVRWEEADEHIYKMAVQFLENLRAPLGVYAILGDADYTQPRESCSFCHYQNSFGTPKNNPVFLRNSHVKLDINQGKVIIWGMDPKMDPSETEWLEKIPEQVPLIILSHSSTVFNTLPSWKNVLVLSGDTHGGQIWLPNFIWKMIRYKPDPTHMHGFFSDGSKSLYVTSGLGTSFPHMRLGVPPELVIIDFLPDNSSRHSRQQNKEKAGHD